ncbi:EF-hand domain-containing protein [Smaragdicoccus niigatensis]|uniref:EF-hand domain-containing protein n=1 Tax=Smaragdicoccus niigatensis TaxID=359359 RepID=UPI0003815310|nr:EF-hand domain-containing protein [Smaragdicoccus niigatensis]
MTLEDLRETFDQFDTDENGAIDSTEFAKLIAVLDPEMSSESVSIGFAAIDEDHNGLIDFTEFVDWWQDR